MKSVTSWSALEPFGVIPLTGEACALGYRLLCDLTAQGKRALERCLSVEIRSENWNSGPPLDPHVVSAMLAPEMLLPLAVFALLEAGCREVWTTDRAAFGIDTDDTDEQVAAMRQRYEPTRRFAFHGPYEDRNQHQISGRVR